jgi:hypothetical protein
MLPSHRRDIEAGPTHREYLDGYPSLAAFIASDPELAVYRRFDRLTTRNLLYLQSELLYLESKLDGFDEDDRKRDIGDDLRASARVWEVLARKGNEHDRERIELVMRSRQLLGEYCESEI